MVQISGSAFIKFTRLSCVVDFFCSFYLNMAIHFMACRPDSKEMGLTQCASLSRYIKNTSQAIYFLCDVEIMCSILSV